MNNKICLNTTNKERNNIFIIIILYTSGVIFYIISLKKIDAVRMECFNLRFIKCYFVIFVLIFISSIIISISINLIILKKYSKFHLCVIFLIYIILLYIDHDNGVIRHGLYNFLLFLLLNILMVLIQIYVFSLFYLYKKAKYLLLILFIFPFPLFYILFVVYRNHNFSCYNWEGGFNNTYIDNTSKNYPCKINIPKPHTCYIEEIGKITDFSAKYRPSCLSLKLLEKEKEILLSNLKKLKFSNESKLEHFGLPITNNREFNPNLYGTILERGKRSFYSDVNSRIILMDLYYKNKSKYYPNISKPEIEILLNENLKKMKLMININKNKKLIKEREKIRKKLKLIYKNVLIFFFDTLSRAHFHRKFKKTSKFLNKFTEYNLNNNMATFEFFKYHSLRSYTDPNVKAVYYSSKLSGKKIHFANYFKDNGFIIGRANTYCEKEIIFNKKKYYLHSLWDHENLSLACLKAFYNSPLIGKLNSLIIKCLFGKQLFQYSLEYLETFLKTYKDENKMFLLQSIEGHEPTNQAIGYLDDILYNHLVSSFSRGFLKDTAIIIFSDHGEHINGPLYIINSLDIKYERTLPLLILAVHNDENLYKKDFYENIKNNQQIFITSYDIHDTLIHLAFGDNHKMYEKNKSEYGSSIFKKLNYKIRYCESTFYNNIIKQCNCQI